MAITPIIFVFISVSNCFLRASLDRIGICCTLFSWLVASLIRVSSFISFIHFAWSIFFFVIMYSIGMLPVSFRRIVVGVPLGRYKRVLIASLKILWSLLFSSFVVFQPSHAYVFMGMTMASTICQIAYIFIPLNSLFPVSAIMLTGFSF